MYRAVSIDYIVIAYAVEATLTMPLVNQFDCAGLRRTSGGAVNDNLIDSPSHESEFCLVNEVHDLSLVFAVNDDASRSRSYASHKQYGPLAVIC